MVQDQEVQNTENTDEVQRKNKNSASTTEETVANEVASEEADGLKASSADVTASADEEQTGSADFDSTGESEKETVRIEFPYSELIREKVPKAFELAEKVATDWKNEGDFTDLGITHPVAGIVAAQALTKAKEVEKKLEEKGVISMAKLGLAIAKSQVETIKGKIVK